MRAGVLRGNLDVDVPGALGVKVRPRNIVHHELFLGLPWFHRGRSADDEPERLQRRCAREECVVGPSTKLFAHQPAPDLRVVEVPFVHVDPFGADDLALRLLLLRPGDNLVDAHVLEEAHLDRATRFDQLDVEVSARDIVRGALDAVLHVQAVQVRVQDLFAGSVERFGVHTMPIMLVHRVDPLVWPIALGS